MLNRADAKPLSQRWEVLPTRTKLPFRWELFVRQQQASWRFPNCRRRVPRTPMRSIAILVHAEKLYAVYTLDVSRQGIGFMAPLNLFPREKVWMELPGRRVVRLVVSRCKRMNDTCHWCGAEFLR